MLYAPNHEIQFDSHLSISGPRQLTHPMNFMQNVDILTLILGARHYPCIFRIIIEPTLSLLFQDMTDIFLLGITQKPESSPSLWRETAEHQLDPISATAIGIAHERAVTTDCNDKTSTWIESAVIDNSLLLLLVTIIFLLRKKLRSIKNL